MKTIAVVAADFERTFLGLPARLEEDLCGETVIRRTLKNIQAGRELSGIFLLVPQAQEAIARSAIAGLDVDLRTHHAAKPPWMGYVSAARKWSLDGWRGGLASTTVYDEFNHPWLLDALAKTEGADAVVDVPAAAPLIDAGLVDGLVRHFNKVCGEVRLGIIQSAPGLSAIAYQTEMLTNLAKGAQPPGRTMAYRPDDPQQDMIMQACLCPTDADISHAWGRCIADTDTSLARLRAWFEHMPADNASFQRYSSPALEVSRWLRANGLTSFESLPEEVEVEITTDDSLPDSTLRPRGKALERTGRMTLDTFERLVRELASLDDRRLVFGGFGDPLLHDQFPQFLSIARESGILGIAVRTSAVSLDEGMIDALLDAEVDVLNVLLDAAEPDTYRRVHRADHYDRVLENIERLMHVQRERQCSRPLIVAELMKTPETLDDMESFYDRWLLKAGSAVIAGPSRYAGMWPADEVVNMAPPTRFACARVFHRAAVLADGRLCICDQDFKGEHAVGRIGESSLQDLWQSDALNEVRQNHLAGRYQGMICAACSEWHRP